MLSDQQNTEGRNSDDLARKLQQLQIRKLRREIKELSAPWWQKPPWIASIATIAVAIIGLLWALNNNFFENRQRELRIQTHDLKAGRDEQGRKYQNEKRIYDTSIAELKRQEAELRGKITLLDVPIVANGMLRDAEWDPLRRAGSSPTLFVRGANFGRTVGRLEVSLRGDDRLIPGNRPIKGVQIVVQQWSDQEITVTLQGLSRASVRQSFSPLLRPQVELLSRVGVRLYLVVTVERSDGRRSPATWVELGPALIAARSTPK